VAVSSLEFQALSDGKARGAGREGCVSPVASMHKEAGSAALLPAQPRSQNRRGALAGCAGGGASLMSSR
jgi:hypothetical protein